MREKLILMMLISSNEAMSRRYTRRLPSRLLVKTRGEIIGISKRATEYDILNAILSDLPIRDLVSQHVTLYILNGDVRCAMWMLHEYGSRVYRSWLFEGIRMGMLEVFEWGFKNQAFEVSMALRIAMEYNHWNILDRIHEIDIACTTHPGIPSHNYYHYLCFTDRITWFMSKGHMFDALSSLIILSTFDRFVLYGDNIDTLRYVGRLFGYEMSDVMNIIGRLNSVIDREVVCAGMEAVLKHTQKVGISGYNGWLSVRSETLETIKDEQIREQIRELLNAYGW